MSGSTLFRTLVRNIPTPPVSSPVAAAALIIKNGKRTFTQSSKLSYFASSVSSSSSLASSSSSSSSSSSTFSFLQNQIKNKPIFTLGYQTTRRTYSTNKNTPLMNSSLAEEMDQDRDIEKLLSQNKEWADEQYSRDPTFFAKMASSQAPDYLYIGCSDSRVPSATILGLGPGELFVHRNVGNVFCSTDFNALTTLEFAVNTLKVKHILVVGHYGCGAVNAAMQKHDHGTIENWLRNIRDVYRLHCEELDAIECKDARMRRLVELNVVESCLNVYKTGIVQQTRLKSVDDNNAKHGEEGAEKLVALPRVHALVYDPADGVLRPLPIKFKALIKRYQHIYDLYQPPEV